MANREQIPPLLACRYGVRMSFPADAMLSTNTDDDGFSARRRETPPSAFVVIAVKASIGLSTKPYVSGVECMALREEWKSFSDRDISSCARFVPIRDDPEMVVNLGLRIAEAGLRRRGVTA